MATVNTEFTVPTTLDRAILTVQDTIDRLGWEVHEMSATRVVVECRSYMQFPINFPKLTVNLKEAEGDSTTLAISVSIVGPMFGAQKTFLTGLMGKFVNSISLRVQTNSIAINPTVSIGEGQGTSSPVGNDRISQLERLKGLVDSGILTDEEFKKEKQRILDAP